MKSLTRKTYLMLCALCLLMCVMMLIVFTPNTPTQVKADVVTPVETKFSVSKDEDSIVFVTPIVVDETEIARIYEVGYTFDGEQPTVINGSKNKYYTSLVTGGNTLTAADIFGGAYEKTTPMIIWEVERLENIAYSATAYYKQGTIVEGTLYKDYNGVPDVAVEGSQKSTSVYEEVKAVETSVDNFIKTYPQVSLENFVAMTASIDTVDTQLATLSETQKASVKNIDKYNELKSSFVVLDDMKGTVADRFTLSGSATDMLNASASANLNHPTYGQCGFVVKNQGVFNLKWKNINNVDLSGYDRIIIGIRNGTNKEFNVYIEDGSNIVWVEQGISASMADHGQYKTLTMSVNDFMTHGVSFNTGTVTGAVWFTSILAVKGSAANSLYLDGYKTALNNENVALSDIKVLDDMLGADVADRFTTTDVSAVLNGTTSSKNASILYKDYGRMAMAVVSKETTPTITLKTVSSEDLDGFTHIALAVYNNTGIALNFHGTLVDSASLAIVVIPVSEYLETGIKTTANANGSFFIGPIVAVNME